MTTAELLPSPPLNKVQSLRVTRILMSSGVYLTCWLLAAILNWQHHVQIPWRMLLMFGVMAIVINTLSIAAVYRGLNLQLKDPSMTQLQMSIATIWGVSLLYFGAPVRAEGLMVFFCIFVFGMFRLNRNQLMAQGVLIVGLYVLMLNIESQVLQQPIPAKEWMRLTFLIMTLIVLALLGGEIFDIRQKLRSRHQALIRANQMISRQATHDALTGIFNRHYLMEALTREEARYRRHGGHLSVIICDLDHFKQLNDRFGHLVGDDVLRNCAECLQAGLRGSDWLTSPDHILARFGGEEFVLLLPDTPLEGARACAERLRLALADLSHDTLPAGSTVTASFGVAQIRVGENTNEMLQRADDALYEAKNAGRNRVAVALL